ncbi:hypothetical protein GW937_00050 [Candidatus Kaiserbacteria bacterium]|nr:hypothetical protein [Candidatus Kaiserbacteria bacterium]
MDKKISEKQLKANQENGKKGGVKTNEGKEVSKYNALKHGILKATVSEYEEEFSNDVMDRLNSQFQPVGVLEKMLVDRIGYFYIRLFRVAKSENEYMKSILNPRKVTVKDIIPQIEFTETIVENEGYIPVLKDTSVEKLTSTYLRYEIALENRMYKAIHELQRLQASRNGEKIPPPLAVDIDMTGDKADGFVS